MTSRKLDLIRGLDGPRAGSEETAQCVFQNSQDGWASDINIWNHKQYRHCPELVPEEAIVHRFRKWFSQFYPESTEAKSD